MTRISGLFFLASLTSALAQVSIGYGISGFDSLTYQNQQYLMNGSILQVDSVYFSDGSSGSVITPGRSFNSQTKTTTVTYTWGTLTAQYSASGNAFNLTLQVSNSSSKAIQQINLEPLWLGFPSAVKEYNGSTPMLAQNIGQPTMIQTTSGNVAVVLTNNDASKPLMVGYPQSYNYPTATQFPLKTWTGSDPTLPNSLLYVNRPIPAGQSDSYHLSLLFAPATESTPQIASAVVQQFAQTFPMKLNWSDRRGIGQIVLATSGTNFPTNPRGWFNDSTVNVTTQAGIAAFQQRLLSFADSAVTVLQGMNAQAAVIWDIEGEQYQQPNPVYFGDPNHYAALAPEMASVASQFFGKFTSAGIRVGVCLRPQTLNIPASGAPSQMDVPDPTQNLLSKVSYAVKTWGASLFYVDSNVTQGANGGGGTMNPSFFQTVYNSYPKVLIMAEHSLPEYNAIGAPYLELAGGFTGTPADVLTIYPNAFSVIYAPNGNVSGNQAALQAAVDRGDILMFRGWWNDPLNASVKTIYANSTYQYPR